MDLIVYILIFLIISSNLLLWKFWKTTRDLKKEIQEHKADKNDMAHIIAVFYRENPHHLMFQPHPATKSSWSGMTLFFVGGNDRLEFEIAVHKEVTEVISSRDRSRDLPKD